MIIDTTMRLEALMAGTATSANPDVHVVYADYNSSGELTRPALNRASLNGVNVVTILHAPVNNPTREIDEITIYNADAQAAVVTVRTNDGTTARVLMKQSLSTTVSLIYVHGTGWQTK